MKKETKLNSVIIVLLTAVSLSIGYNVGLNEQLKEITPVIDSIVSPNITPDQFETIYRRGQMNGIIGEDMDKIHKMDSIELVTACGMKSKPIAPQPEQ